MQLQYINAAAVYQCSCSTLMQLQYINAVAVHQRSCSISMQLQYIDAVAVLIHQCSCSTSMQSQYINAVAVHQCSCSTHESQRESHARTHASDDTHVRGGFWHALVTPRHAPRSTWLYSVLHVMVFPSWYVHINQRATAASADVCHSCKVCSAHNDHARYSRNEVNSRNGQAKSGRIARARGGVRGEGGGEGQ